MTKFNTKMHLPSQWLSEEALSFLLGRSVNQFEEDATQEKYYRGLSILITGAGGSIGQGLVRRLSALKLKKITLLDSAETNLFYAERESLRSGMPAQTIQTVLGSACDAKTLDKIFKQNDFDLVFHVGAYKHVSLLQTNPQAAILNNMDSLKKVHAACVKHRVRQLVFVSSDKAVNPSCVMGKTKRASELFLLSHMNEGGKNTPATSIVRFGNIIGSSGSVLPIFVENIVHGEPLQVSDPEVNRYFMTLDEATHLMLLAASLPRSQGIFIFDEYKATRIFDLAHRLIKLLNVRSDYPVVISKLKAGEKMSEALFSPRHESARRVSQWIQQVESQRLDRRHVKSQYNAIIQNARQGDLHKALALLEKLITDGVGSASDSPDVAA